MAYINRENLIQVLAHENSNTEIGRQYYGAIYQKVMNFPTADVVEVKHGHWIKTDRGFRKNPNTGEPMRVYYCDCSCCGWHTGNQGVEFKRCPMCGAIMDGGKEE